MTAGRARTGRVIVAGLVPPGPSGMRDYGDLVAGELGRRGLDAETWWIENDGVTFPHAVGASMRALWAAARERPGSVVVWNYSPFAYAFRGIPLPGVLVGLVLRARRATVVTVFHEIAYPWGRRGLAGRLFAVSQRAALAPILAGSHGFLVTTEERATFVRRWARLHRAGATRVAPVFSTVGRGAPPGPAPQRVGRIGVIGYGGDGARPELFFAAIGRAGLHPDEGRVVLVGAPGPHSEAGQAWVGAARRAGLEPMVEFSGVLSVDRLSSCIAGCDLIALVDEEGPTSRRTMLAAALAHGRPVVATDGPNRWETPVREAALAVAPADPEALGALIRRLSEDPAERAAMGARAFAFYEREMSLGRTCDVLCALVSDLAPEPAPAADVR